jgi:protein phosphatase
MTPLYKLSKFPIGEVIKGDYDKIVVIGDVHGCYTKLMRLLKQVNWPNTAYVFLGDLIDRGEEPGRVVEEIMNKEHTFCVLGNHEEKHFRYALKQRDVATKNDMKTNDDFIKTHDELTEKHLHFINKMPTYIIWQDFIFTHAGIIAGWSIKQPMKGFIRNRYVKRSVSPSNEVLYSPSATWQDPEGNWKHDPEAIHWSDIWYGDIKSSHSESDKIHWKVVYGHEPLDQIKIQNDTFGIDTGAAYGNKLTAMVIDRNKEIQFVQV